MKFDLENSVNQEIRLSNSDITLYIKREDCIHPFVSGNKYRKLKYNLQEAQRLQIKTLLTFGGAFSNHIAAVAAAGKGFGFNTIGVIRGEELEDKVLENPTLTFAKEQGMAFKFISRTAYRTKTDTTFLEALKQEFGDFYLVPEGGTNALAVKGCEEVLREEDSVFDYICCAVGTGGTISGLINASKPHQQILGFPVLKGAFLKEDISKFVTTTNWKLITNYHFGGYAKINTELVEFINQFKASYNVPLDPIYTGKMVFGIMDMIAKGVFKRGAKILVIHTGGLQGIFGMNVALKNKNLPIIK